MLDNLCGMTKGSTMIQTFSELRLLIIEKKNLFFLWCNTNKRSAFICAPLFAEWTENALQKSHSVNMCIIIHSSGRIVCLLWPHFQRAQKQAGGVGSSEQRPFFPTRLGLRNAHHSAGTEPFTGLLAAHEWQLNHQELFPSTGDGWLHCKNYLAKLKYILVIQKTDR